MARSWNRGKRGDTDEPDDERESGGDELHDTRVHASNDEENSGILDPAIHLTQYSRASEYRIRMRCRGGLGGVDGVLRNAESRQARKTTHRRGGSACGKGRARDAGGTHSGAYLYVNRLGYLRIYEKELRSLCFPLGSPRAPRRSRAKVSRKRAEVDD